MSPRSQVSRRLVSFRIIPWEMLWQLYTYPCWVLLKATDCHLKLKTKKDSRHFWTNLDKWSMTMTIYWEFTIVMSGQCCTFAIFKELQKPEQHFCFFFTVLLKLVLNNLKQRFGLFREGRKQICFTNIETSFHFRREVKMQQQRMTLGFGQLTQPTVEPKNEN